MARFNWKYGTLAVAEASRGPVTCSAGPNQAQEYLSPMEVTGTAGGGSAGATFGYEWKLVDPEGNARDYWITGSNLSSMSFNAGNFPHAGNWLATLIVSSSDPDDAIQSASSVITMGSASWIRFNPNYGVDYHYTGSTTVDPRYFVLNWADSGTFTEVTCSVPSDDANKFQEYSIQWVDTKLPIAGSSSLYPSGVLRSIDWKLIYDVPNMLTSGDEFYAGWVVGNPQEHDGYGLESWGGGGIDFACFLNWFGSATEENTSKFKVSDTPGTTVLSFGGQSGANFATSVVGSFYFDMHSTLNPNAPKFDTVRHIRLSQSVAVTDAGGVAINSGIVPTASIMKLGACIGRGDEGLTLTASLRLKWFYRLNRGYAGGDDVF